MTACPLILMTDPAHYEVAYRINPWMEPGAWSARAEANRAAARDAFHALGAALRAAGAATLTIPGTAGLPDMVFPANAGVVLDRRVLVARFAHPQRQGETAAFLDAFRGLVAAGLLDAAEALPEDTVQEGAGDAIWDANRQLFWTGHGQRSTVAGAHAVGAFFGKEIVPLTLATESFYHLDTCFCPLSGGEVLYYPPAFTPEALALIHERVDPGQRLEAGPEDAARLCVNAVNIGRSIVMAEATDVLRARLTARGYAVREVDLRPFIASGGAAYCMTLRLDRTTTGR